MSEAASRTRKLVPESIHNSVTPDNTNVLTEVEMMNNRPTPDRVELGEDAFPVAKITVGNGDVLIAAITSCTNTSNPAVMIAAGIVAKKAVERGMKVPPLRKDVIRTRIARRNRIS